MARLNERPLRWRRRRATAAAPKPESKSSKAQIAAVVIIALIVIGGAYYYFAVYSSSSSGSFSERIRIEIGGYFYNSTDPANSVPASYYPSNFTVARGAHITLVITNEDNKTHGLAAPQFNIDTGPMKPNSTATLSFVANPVGNYTYSEPSADCGGGNCDAGQDLNGTFTVAP
jgi:heme/copper-type cytochrome/quinol oxidase subunit 2